MKSLAEFRTSFNSCESTGFKNSRHQIAIDFYDVCRHQQHPGFSCDALLLWQGVRGELRALQKRKVRILHLLVTHRRGSLMLYTEYFSHIFAAFCESEIYSYIHAQFKISNTELAWRFWEWFCEWSHWAPSEQNRTPAAENLLFNSSNESSDVKIQVRRCVSLICCFDKYWSSNSVAQSHLRLCMIPLVTSYLLLHI